MLIDYYSLKPQKQLEEYFSAYLPLVITVLGSFDMVDFEQSLVGDHLGMQVLSVEEFDTASEIILEYSTLIHDAVIHNRRNRVYEFNKPLIYKDISIPRIEIFEPKPNADLSKLKPGIEHIAFYSESYDKVLQHFTINDCPIDKQVEFKNGSKFFKTSFINLVEVEFRNNYLGLW